MKRRLWRCVAAFSICILVIAGVAFVVGPGGTRQALTLSDGGKIELLGITGTGTNHWNPSIHLAQRAAVKGVQRVVPSFAGILVPKLLSRIENSPSMASFQHPAATSAAAIWFMSHARTRAEGKSVVVRCLGATGEELGPARNVDFSRSKVAIVWLMNMSPGSAEKIRFLELIERNSPLRRDPYVGMADNFYFALNPISEMALDPGRKLGRFEVEPGMIIRK